jgi:essential nuclear protein 1
MKVVWHQSLLVFVQRYKMDLTEAHFLKLKSLLKTHHHHQITIEIRRELFQNENIKKHDHDMTIDDA